MNLREVTLLAGEVVNADQNGAKANASVIMKNLPDTLPNSHVISSAGVSCNADRLHFAGTASAKWAGATRRGCST